MVTQLGRKVFLSGVWLDLSRLMKDLIGVMSQICLILNNFKTWNKLGEKSQTPTEKFLFIGPVLGLNAIAGQVLKNATSNQIPLSKVTFHLPSEVNGAVVFFKILET